MTTDNIADLSDPRGQPARTRMINAFNAMVLGNAPRPWRVGEIVARAKVARSTFYDHFDSSDAILLEAMRGPFRIFADVLAGTKGEIALIGLLDHFRDKRVRALEILNGPMRDRLARLLEQMIADRLDGPADNRLTAIQLTAATLAPLTPWLQGRMPLSSPVLAARLCAAATAIRAVGQDHEPTE